MNEGFFKECMRQYHIFHIRQLRKVQINSQIAQAVDENHKLSLESLENELKKAQQLNAHLQSEVKKLESRLKILDLSHTQRFSNTTNQLREKTKNLLHTQTDLEGRKGEIKRLEERLGAAQSRIVDFETKMGFFKAEVDKNEILTSENSDLKMKLGNSSISKNLAAVVESPNLLLDVQVAELQLLNNSLKMQLSHALEKQKELEKSSLSKNEGRLSLLQARLEAKVCPFYTYLFNVSLSLIKLS